VQVSVILEVYLGRTLRIINIIDNFVTTNIIDDKNNIDYFL